VAAARRNSGRGVGRSRPGRGRDVVAVGDGRRTRVTVTLTTDAETYEQMVRQLDLLIGEFDLVADVRRD
jgi:hypothetical protein